MPPDPPRRPKNFPSRHAARKPFMGQALPQKPSYGPVFSGINIFPKGTQSRTISINAQYQALFRNPRDSLQISILARQLCPLNSKDFLDIYKRASQRPYGYLFCCSTQSSSLLHKRFT